MPLKDRDIAILTLLVAIGGLMFTVSSSSSDLEHFTFTPPNEINQYSKNSFNFKVHNYGDDSGSYILQASSEEFLVKIDSALHPEYSHDSSIKSNIDADDDDEEVWRVDVIANKTNLPNNASFKFTYYDTSPPIFKKEDTWLFLYEIDDSQRNLKYNFVNMTYDSKTFIMLGNLKFDI
ncbi:hypothetical protein RE476_00975 [Methanolobus mangrovi]|uniref:DUF1616 domain-containing protein n=1 Tax=Methanolobus mangrovi TaxID=3072977 RepID=A0AA51UIP4_9EURY|nr:hypothetical protein [Methanolobus mangrovi]WMW22421.1 hypothetical protein RE476_00975 [Methanolobus mangrovi]